MVMPAWCRDSLWSGGLVVDCYNLSKSLSENYSSDFIGLRVSAGEESGAGRCLAHRSSPVTLAEPAGDLGDGSCFVGGNSQCPASLPAAASHLLIAKVMKFLEYFSDRL